MAVRRDKCNHEKLNCGLWKKYPIGFRIFRQWNLTALAMRIVKKMQYEINTHGSWKYDQMMIKFLKGEKNSDEKINKKGGGFWGKISIDNRLINLETHSLTRDTILTTTRKTKFSLKTSGVNKNECKPKPIKCITIEKKMENIENAVINHQQKRSA